VAERLLQRMLAIETLCPDVNDDHLIEPGFESSTRLAKILKIVFADLLSLPILLEDRRQHTVKKLFGLGLRLAAARREPTSR
jgi:hypothetical protein